MNLKNKVVVITGASSGIGASVARELSAAGANIVLTARRKELLLEVQQTLTTESALLALDVCSVDAGDRLLTLAKKQFGGVDIIINNAGVMSTGPIDAIDLNVMADMIKINFEAVMRLSYTFAREFKKQGQGAIINVSSIGASLTPPAMGVYSAVKAAVEVFTQSLRIELAGSGVKVGIIAPGSTKTQMYEGMKSAAEEQAVVDTIVALESTDIANAVRFMLEQPKRSNIAKMNIYPAEEMF
jgi:NADP-dependent 3-hydroxy acid dehydrogenase YdfG